jgi:hypothetical protein
MQVKWHPLQLLTAFGGLTAIVAAFMPWVEARADFDAFFGDIPILEDLRLTVSGTEADGYLTLFLGVCVIACILAGIYAGLDTRISSLLAGAFGVGIVVIGALAWSDLQGFVDVNGTELEDLPFIETSVKHGLILTVGSGILAAFGGFSNAVVATTQTVAVEQPDEDAT